jgi:hypothetical protein
METQKAVLISGSEYLELQSPEFVGQTKPDAEGNYRMYWRQDGNLYYTANKLEIETIKVMPISLPARMVIFSHLSDAQELIRLGGNGIHQINRINFAKWLLGRYPDTSVDIDPDKEYKEFIENHPNMKF